MRYSAYNETIQHRTGDLPLAYYDVDERHPRYHMRVHWHREVELLRMRRGILRILVDNTPLELRAGDLLLLGEGAMHGGDAEDGAYECIVLNPYALLMHVEPCKNAIKALIGTSMRLSNRTISETDGFSAALDRFYERVRVHAAGDELQLIGAIYEVFGYLSGQTVPRLARPPRSVGAKAEQLEPALAYIEQNYGGHISLETLARQTGLSPKYLCRCFREIFQNSPIDYLNHYRIECACDLLTSTDMTVAEIAQRCGFGDSSAFIKQFKKYKEITPLRYRHAEDGARKDSV